MNLDATRRCGRIVLGITFLLLFYSVSSHAQHTTGERSTVFEPTFDEKIEHTLSTYQQEALQGLGSRTFEELQKEYLQVFGREETLLSLNLFRSLHEYYRGRPYAVQSITDRTLSKAAPGNRTKAHSALLSALAFYAHSPLRRADVKAGLARLTAITSISGASAPVQPEIYFWRAEGFRALGELSPAEEQYRRALSTAFDQKLRALTEFRLAELLERQQRYASADSAFRVVSRIPESPLMLIATIRRAAVQRSMKSFRSVLQTLDAADSLLKGSGIRVVTSARDVNYTSPLIQSILAGSSDVEKPDISSTTDSQSARTHPTPQLLTLFSASDCALLRGSALSELGEYQQATSILRVGESLVDRIPDSSLSNPSLREQARFESDALRFEEAWSLFQQAKYEVAAGAFLQLAVNDSIRRQRLLVQSPAALREQGKFFDPFLNDSTSLHSSPDIDRSVLAKQDVDTSLFFYNDFPERARFYAGIALARAGMLTEASDVLLKPTLDKSMLYSDRAQYQLALIRFAQHSYEALKLLEPIAFEQSIRGAYASLLLGELSYRKKFYEKAESYFANSYANLPLEDTASRASAHLERGLSLIPLGNWTEAARELHAFLATSNKPETGKTDEALYWLGKSYFRSKQYDSARVTLRKVLLDFPTSERKVDAQYGYAWTLFEANEFKLAEPEFEKVIALDSNTRYSYDALSRAGDCYYAIGDYTKAAIIYNQAVDQPAFNDYRTTRANMMLGLTRMRLDSGRSAMNGFGYVASKYSKAEVVDAAYLNKALSAYSINQTEAAEQSIDKLVSLYHSSPLSARGLFIAGEERVRRDDLLGATGYYKRVIKEYPRSTEAGRALFALQDALVQLKRSGEALAIADSFVNRYPDHSLRSEIILHSGQLKLQVGDGPSALRSFQQFLANYPTSPDRPHAELGVTRAMLLSKDTTAALAAIRSFVSTYDTMDIASSAYLERARVFRARKMVDSAARDFQAAFDPKYYSSDAAPQAMFEYAGMLSETKRIDSAITIYVDLSTHYPLEATISTRGALRAGELLESKGRHKEARTQFDRIALAHPTDVWGGAAKVRAGESFLAQGEERHAADAFDSARENWSLSTDAAIRALYGLARANARLGKKADAIRNLRELLEMRGLSAESRDNATSLLLELQPRKQKKHSKGRVAE